MIKHAEIVNKVATIGLVGVLIALLGLSTWMVWVTHQLDTQAIDYAQVSNLFRQTERAISAEDFCIGEYYHRSYRLTLISVCESISENATANLHQLAQGRDINDRKIANEMLSLNARLWVSLQHLINAENQRDEAKVAHIHIEEIDPVFIQLEQKIYKYANGHYSSTKAGLQRLSNTQHMIFLAFFLCFGSGIIFIFLYFWLLTVYRKKGEIWQKREIERLEQLALIDTLTRLGNHRAYQEDIKRLEAGALQNHEQLNLALINVDELKMINDQHGHLYGDHILSTLGNVLKEFLHTTYAYRLSGDEFAVIFPGECEFQVIEKMEQVRQEIRNLCEASVSIGISHTSEDGRVDTLREQAEAALTEAKRKSRDTIVVFDDIRESAEILSFSKVIALRKMLNEKKLTIAFQPIWDLQKDGITAFEALTRPSNVYGFDGPQEAFDIAEKIGRAHELDYVCFQAILARAAELPPDTLLFINLSPQSLAHDLLTGAVLLNEVVLAGLKPERVVLEITERSIVELPRLVQQAKLLKEIGFHLALDDTGAGNAGLEMLSHLPVDFVKIDRQIVWQAVDDKTARSIVVAIKHIAHEGGMFVIAEGIETQEMLEMVRAMGVENAQGYLLGRPSEKIPENICGQRLWPLAETS